MQVSFLEDAVHSHIQSLPIALMQARNDPSAITDEEDTAVSIATPSSNPFLEQNGNLARYSRLVVLHCFLSFVICNADRIVMSVAIIPMAEEYGWSQSVKGVVQSVFFVGYMTTQIPGGRLADRLGGRPVLAAGVSMWSAMTLLVPLSARISFSSLLVTRVFLGVGEGVAMPAMNTLVRAHVPRPFISRSLSVIYSGMNLGSILGLFVTPMVIHAYNWTAAFYLFGVSGWIWVLAFIATTADRVSLRNTNSSGNDLLLPSTGSAISLHASDTECSGNPFEPDPAAENPSTTRALNDDSVYSTAPCLWDMLSKRPVWAIIIAHFCSTWGYFILLMWLPSYLSSRFHLDIKSSAFLAATPWVTMFLCTNLSGILADNLISRGYCVTSVRKLMQSVGFLGPAFCLMLLIRIDNLAPAVVTIMIGLGLSSFSQSGVYCNHQDISGESECAGTLLGISNTVASLPGVIGVGVTGFILDSTNGNWSAVFATSIFFYVIGTIMYCILGSSERLF